MLTFTRHAAEHGRMGQLSKLFLFSTLHAKELRVVDALLHERTYLAGEIVFDEGEEGQALYVVVKGRVAVCHQGRPVDGRVTEFTDGMLFGELALLDGMPRSLQAVAVEDTTLAALSRADFTGLVETHAVIASKIALQLARDLGHKLRENFIRMDERPL